LLYLMIFLLGVFGSLGLERGNVDIILSLFFGFLMIWILTKPNDQKTNLKVILKAICIGFICAFLVNVKLFLLPVAVVAIYSSRKILITILSFVVMFSLLGYLPYVLFHAPSNPLSSVISSMQWGVGMFSPYYIMRLNNTFNAIASLATNCVQRLSCEGRLNSFVISTISFVLFIFTFIYPFLASPFIKSRLTRFKQQIKAYLSGGLRGLSIVQIIGVVGSMIRWMSEKRADRKFIILLFILSVAILDLMPMNSFGYRLYYFLPLLLLLWKETENNRRARVFCLLSIILLSVKGLWIFMDVNPAGFNIFESRGMSLFVVLSFYFMIKSGIELVASKVT
jgi:hypothetical protein